MSTGVFLRPWFLLGLVPTLCIAIYWWGRSQKQNDWHKFCDPMLLTYLQKTQINKKWRITWGCIVASLISMVIGLAGPSWHRLPSSIGQVQKPVMIVMDLSTHMLLDDVTPSRLERSKFLIEDLLNAHQDMQWGLLIFTQMPFLVSPITNDIQNILNFLPALSPNILPVGGYDVMRAINKAQQLMQQAGFTYGKIIVVSSQKPDEKLAQIIQNNYELVWVYASSTLIQSSTMNVIDIKHASVFLNKWLSKGFYFSKKEILQKNQVMQWKDEGRWFLFLAMLLIVYVFRRGWFLRLWV
jgi:Ca-activated chloride channel family protein